MPNQNEQTPTEAPRNQAGQSQKDDPRQAPESGEPQAAGRQRGHVVDEQSREIEGTGTSERGKPGDNQDWESGRQQAL
jgi:hypothetical protein